MQNDFENGPSESERTLQTTGCCATITRQLTLRFQFENLAKKNSPVLPHPPYSPDLAPCDFYLFSKLKGHHFGTMEYIQKVVTVEDTHLQKMTSGTAMISGKNVGTTV